MTTSGPDNVHLPVRADWLAQRDEEVLHPDLPIIDAHHHLWDKSGHRYLLDDFLDDCHGHANVRATVFIECHTNYLQEGPPELRSLGESEFASRAAAAAANDRCAVAAGIVCNVDLRWGAEASPLLERHAVASGGRLRGVRNTSAYHEDPAARGSLLSPPPGLLYDRGFREGFSQLERMGLSFDAWMYHTQLHELVDLARAFPHTTIALNHVGGPLGIGPYRNRREDVFTFWRDAILQVACLPNVYVKLGGLGMRMFGFNHHEQKLPPSSAELAECWRPYVETCVEAFGPDRCMFESNFPVDKGTASYNTTWNTFKRIASQYGRENMRKLLFDNANAFYRLNTSA